VKDGVLTLYYALPGGGFQQPGLVLLNHVQDVAVGNFRGLAFQDLAVLFDNFNLRQTGLNLYANVRGKFPAFIAIPVPTLFAFDQSCRTYSGNFSSTRYMDIAVVCPSQGLDIHVGTNDGKGAFRFHITSTRDVQARVDQVVEQMLDSLRNQR
jgi:hypothetical protein